MIDPLNFTNFHRTGIELEEAILWSVLVAGKNALTTAKALDRLLQKTHQLAMLHHFQPFMSLVPFTQEEIKSLLLEAGIGCQDSKSLSLVEIVNSNIDLRTCSTEDLEKIHGIGPKTSRMFIMHSRPNVRLAALDIHILHYLRDCGIDAPRTTPPNKKKYVYLENEFLRLADENNMSAADFDLYLWKKYRNKAS